MQTTDKPMTVDEFISDENWPPNSIGFRLRRGRAVWTCARYTEGNMTGLAQVSRIVHEGGQAFTRTSSVDPSTPIEFVYLQPPAVICENCGGGHADGARGRCTTSAASPCGACHACRGECGDLFADDAKAAR